MGLAWKVCRVRWRRRGKLRTSVVEGLTAMHAKQIVERRAGASEVKVVSCKPARS